MREYERGWGGQHVANAGGAKGQMVLIGIPDMPHCVLVSVPLRSHYSIVITYQLTLKQAYKTNVAGSNPQTSRGLV